MKLHSLGLVAKICEELKASGYTIALGHGCYDLITLGHAQHLRLAKKLADALVVTVTPDKFVNKGPGRPLFPEWQRAEALAALAAVDYVAVNEWPTAVETIKLLQPSVFVKGNEFKNKLTQALRQEKEAVESVGGQLAFASGLEFHSTAILEKLCKLA